MMFYYHTEKVPHIILIVSFIVQLCFSVWKDVHLFPEPEGYLSFSGVEMYSYPD